MKTRGIKEILLLFVIGIFIGSIFYFVFQPSFRQNLDGFEDGLANMGSQEGISKLEYFLFTLWERGRGFAFLWLIGCTRWKTPYTVILIVYKGLSVGFLLCFYLTYYGLSGLLRGGAYYFPHSLFYVTAYLSTIYFLHRGRHTWNPKSTALIGLCLLMGCISETFLNLPIMRSFYR